MKTLLWSPAFIKASKRLSRRNPQLISAIEQSLRLLAEDPFHPSLRTHKLKGDRADIWSCSIDYSNRILFKFVRNIELGEDEILLLTIGNHDEVY